MKLSAVASVDVPRPPADVFDHVTAEDVLPKLLRPLGPIPGVEGSALIDATAPAPGVLRRVAMSDRTEVIEEILVWDRPSRHQYRWTRPPAFPFSLFVRGAVADWTITPGPTSTHLQWVYTFELTTPLAWPVVIVLKAIFTRWMSAALDRARRNLEVK